MNIKTARIISLIFSALLFLSVFFCITDTTAEAQSETLISETSQVSETAEAKPLRIGIKFAEHTNAETALQVTKVFEKTPETKNTSEKETENTSEYTNKDTPVEHLQTEYHEKIQPAAQSTMQFIDTYIDLDTSVNSALVSPVIDLQKIYSRIVYPSSMRRKNIETSFYLRVFIDKLGNVSIKIPDNVDSSFSKAVQNAFKKIKAQPATLNNKPIDVSFSIPIQFLLF